MTNVFATPQKVSVRRKLFELGEKALSDAGWRVTKIPGVGKSSVRRISRLADQHVVSIRTTQDCWIAFPRNDDDSGWVTLDDVDYVLAVTVDDKDEPRRASAYLVEADEMRARFDKAYRARLDAGHSIPLGRGVWVSMFVPEDPTSPSTVGGGIALGKQPLLSISIDGDGINLPPPMAKELEPSDEGSLTITEAKRRLALSLGVSVDKIRIVIEA